jgi:hypothetical protein
MRVVPPPEPLGLFFWTTLALDRVPVWALLLVVVALCAEIYTVGQWRRGLLAGTGFTWSYVAFVILTAWAVAWLAA